MSEQAPDGFHPHSEEHEVAVEPSDDPAESVRTGVASVDRVLDELDAIDELPLEEHVPAFERAHDGLRSALDDAPDDAHEVSPSSVQEASSSDVA